MLQLTREERNRVRSRITAALCNCRPPVRFYWVAVHRRITVRSAIALKTHTVPGGALLIGEYWPGIPARDVVADLEDVLACPPPVLAQHAAPACVEARATRRQIATSWHWAAAKFNW